MSMTLLPRPGPKTKVRVRGLTRLLETKLNGLLLLPDGTQTTPAEFVAEKIAELLTDGQCQMVGGRVFKASLYDWLEIVKFVYGQIDGPVESELAGMDEEEALEQARSRVQIYIPDNGRQVG